MRSLGIRRGADVCLSFVRLDITEDLAYPTATSFRLFAGVFPVLVYYFQAKFLSRGETYTFTLTGLAVAAALQAALTGFGSRLQIAQDQGTFETILVEPVPWRLIPIIMNVWRTCVGFMTMTLMLGVGILLGARYRVTAIPAFAGVILLGALACMAVGTLSASLLVLAKRSEPVLAIYGLAASLLGGALFPIDVLPSSVRWMSYLVPHAYVISAARQVLMIDPPNNGISLGVAVAALSAFNLVVFALGFALFGHALQYARRMGLLGGY